MSNSFGRWLAHRAPQPDPAASLAAIVPLVTPNGSRVQWSGTRALWTPDAVTRSYVGALGFRDHTEENSLRRPQVGALHSVLGHWASGVSEPGIVVMPTGTGKTETMLALMVAARPQRILVLVPTMALWDQVATKFEGLGVLQELQIVGPSAQRPVVGRLEHGISEAKDARRFAEACNVVVATPYAVAACATEARTALLDSFSHLMVDEAHHAPQPPTWEQIRVLLDREEDRHGRRLVVFQYYVDASGVLLFVMSADRTEPELVPVGVDHVELVRFADTAFRVRGGVRMLMEDFADGGNSAWQSFRGLVTEAGKQTKPDDIVYLIPYGPLHDLPLHTLEVLPGVPLGLRNPVCYSPSLAVLAHVLGRPRRTDPEVAVFGDPDSTLLRARTEAVEIAAILGTTAVTEAGATRAAVTAALESAATVHVAAHARASVTNGLTSGIRLADGVLTTADLLSVAVRADLVVLSCCETGIGQHRAGDEAVGLVRALLHGGARTLLTTQWQINSSSAAAVLADFHAQATKLARADALRAALNKAGDDHFYHWGGYVLIGDWR